MMNVTAGMCMSRCSFQTGMRWGLAGVLLAMVLTLTLVTRLTAGEPGSPLVASNALVDHP